MSEKTSNKNIIFVDKAEYAKDAIQRLNGLGDGIIVALNSMSMWQLEKLGQVFKMPLDYYDYDELLQLNEQLYEVAENICQYMDDKLVENISFFRCKDFRPSRSLYYLIKVALNTLCCQNMHIQKVLEGERPDKVYYFIPSRNKILSRGVFCSDEMQTWPETIRANADSKGIDSYSAFKKIQNGRIENLKDYLLKLSRLLNRLSRKRQFHTHTKNSYDSAGEPKEDLTILIYKTGFSIGTFLERIKGHNLAKVLDFSKINKRTFNSSGLKTDIDRYWNALLQDYNFISLFSFNGINLFPNIKQYIGYLVKRYFILVPEYMAAIESLIESERVDALLTTFFTFPDEWLCAAVCRYFEIPIFTWQHGNYGMSRPHSQPVYTDIRDADYWFAFGEGTKDAYTDMADRWNTGIIPVGSCTLEEISRKKEVPLNKKKIGDSTKRKVIVPLRHFNERTFREAAMRYPPLLYWHEITKRIQLFSKFDDMEFILKLVPGSKDVESNHIIDFVKYKNIKNVKFIKTVSSLSEFISDSDLVLIDTPSTTLLQAMSTDKQIICIKNAYWRKMPSEIEALVKKRCYMASNIGELESLLVSYSKDELVVFDNDEFLYKFGLYRREGKAWQRVFDSILEISRKRRTA